VKTVLLAGKTGQVGWELQRALAPLGRLIALGRNEMDLTNPDSIRSAIRSAKPDVIVNAAGYATVDKAESEIDLVTQVNAVAPGILAEEAKRIGAALVHYSTDFVYDGLLGRPYTENDPPNPVNAYGKSKLAGEYAIQAAGGTHLILRTSWVYSARGSNFVLAILRLAREKPLLQVVSDQVGSPSWARALAEATAELLRNRRIQESHGGIYHLSAAGTVSRFEFAKAIIHIMQEVPGMRDGWASVVPITSDQYPLPAKRPHSPITNKDKCKRVFGVEMADWKTQLESFLRELVATSPQQTSRF